MASWGLTIRGSSTVSTFRSFTPFLQLNAPDPAPSAADGALLTEASASGSSHMQPRNLQPSYGFLRAALRNAISGSKARAACGF